MHEVLVLGSGKIGSLIACLLAETGSYAVHLGDLSMEGPAKLAGELSLPNVTPCAIDALDPPQLGRYLSAHRIEAVISSLPYFCNPPVAEQSKAHKAHYFDLTEDVEVTAKIRALARGSAHAFVPQCGLAPGFISIVTNDLMTRFENLDTVKMRVGALPVNPSNALKYSLTWSTDGLINEYGNSCEGIERGVKTTLLPLEGYETIELDGLLYEAFNTSGGLGTLAETYAGRVQTMNYKTLRYPGHCEKIQLLMRDLKLNDDRATLKRILERAVPRTLQDVVLIYASASGTRQGELFEETYVKKVYPATVSGRQWSAIQVTTASSLCCVVDLLLADPGRYRGLVTQETFSLAHVLANRFGVWFR